ncbi:sulfotransferase family 2 domain-containing protein [Fodinibius saliphilus]|uniref:sulfotransferase family 2 domain-containing protein n=1 Tax=Fodinibius saliphilus TaxID=1920650 RepID=UPI001107D99A|nr:sulfotransferase family 2 domain-containing protein [Fodinibius saliphilus]
MIKKTFYSFFYNLRLYFYYGARRVGMPGYQVHQIVLPGHQLIYIPIPKNACSSIKHLLYELEFDQEYNYKEHREWGYQNIHDYYHKRPQAFTGVKSLEADSRNIIFAVVRDPVKRFISCYRNRVIDLQDLKCSQKELEKRGLPVIPDINFFVDHLIDYSNINTSLEHHLRPQYLFLGNSLTYLDEIFTLSELSKLEERLQKYNSNIELRSEKSGGSSYSLQDLTRESLEKVIDYYSRDYKLLEDYFSADEVRKKYQKG